MFYLSFLFTAVAISPIDRDDVLDANMVWAGAIYKKISVIDKETLDSLIL